MATVSPLRSTDGKRSKRDLSVIVLLLAAETVACASSKEDMTLTEMTARCDAEHRLLLEGTDQPSKVPTPTPPHKNKENSNNHNNKEEVEQEEERGESEPAESSSTAGETDSEHAHESSAMTASTTTATTTATSAAVVLSGDVLSEVLSYLPWRCAFTCRGVNRMWLRASLCIVALCRMPHSGTKALFFPCHTAELEQRSSRAEAALSSASHQPWVCANCGAVNARHRIQCTWRQCHALAPAHWPLQRIFLGQLRRTHTVAFIEWVCSRVLELPPHSLACVENHVDRTTHRGKGCAWVSVRGSRSAALLLSFHHKAFYDTVRGIEGMWVTRDTAGLAQESRLKEQLSTMPRVNNNNNNIGRHNNNNNNSQRGGRYVHPLHMPRSALVAEATAGQRILRGALLATRDNTAQYIIINNNNNNNNGSSISVHLRHNPYGTHQTRKQQLTQPQPALPGYEENNNNITGASNNSGNNNNLNSNNKNSNLMGVAHTLGPYTSM